MKYTAIFEESGKTRYAHNYTNILAAVSEELAVTQSELYLEPDPNDGNQYERVFLGGTEETGGKLVACIYDEDQYARIRS